MTTNKEKIQIAKDFVDLHKNDNIEEWISVFEYPHAVSDDDKYLVAYNKLINDVYGNVSEDDPNDFSIEVSQFETKSGHTQIFNF